jgi:hypothetical protein
MTLMGPMGSAVYFVFLFINGFAFPPVAGSNYPNHIMAIRESDRHDPINPPEAVESLFGLAVRQILGNHTFRIGKGELCL